MERLSGGNQEQASQSSLPRESHKTYFIPPASHVTTGMKHLPRLSVQGFNWEAGHMGFCQNTYRNPRLLKGKQVFSISNVVCTVWVQRATLLSEGMGTLLKPKIPDARQGTTLRGNLRILISGLTC